MRIRFDDIPEEGLRLNFTGDEDILSHALESTQPTKGLDISPRVEGYVQILVNGKDYFLLGTVNGVMHLQCSRCLADFSINKQIDLNMVIRRGAEKPGEKEPDEPEQDVIHIDGPEIELAEIILQELLLEVPMKPLCRDDCPGLCSKCGALKGSPECVCPQETPTDQRWAVIERLKKGLAP